VVGIGRAEAALAAEQARRMEEFKRAREAEAKGS
jgi:hypothetical protein